MKRCGHSNHHYGSFSKILYVFCAVCEVLCVGLVLDVSLSIRIYTCLLETLDYGV